MINNIKKTPEIKALELQQAKDILAQYYKETLTVLEESSDPLARVQQTVNAPEHNALLESEHRLFSQHEKDRSALHKMHHEQLHALIQNNPNLQVDALSHVLARHQNEEEKLALKQNLQFADICHEWDQGIGIDTLKEKTDELLEKSLLFPFFSLDYDDVHPGFGTQVQTTNNLDNEEKRTLAEQELKAHHYEEDQTVYKSHQRNINLLIKEHYEEQITHEQFSQSYHRLHNAMMHDADTLRSLHQKEMALLEQSDTPLENTREVVNDANRFKDFNTYVDERLKEAKAMIEREEQEKVTKNNRIIGSEEYLREHLQKTFEQHAFDHIEVPPSLYDGYIANEEKWPKDMFVEGGFAEYSEFERDEHHSIDWEKHDFSNHYVTLEFQENDTLIHDDGFDMEE